eukprot:9394684-Alexandrium_andersonii.AAC.1
MRCACWLRVTSPATASLANCSGTSRGTETAGVGWSVAAGRSGELPVGAGPAGITSRPRFFGNRGG